MSIGRGSWVFKRGEWTDIRQDVWLNEPGKQDGGFNIWSVPPPSLSLKRLATDEVIPRRINGKLILSSSTVFYRNLPNIKVGLPGTIPTPRVELIDYDSLPANITIPNGGFARPPSFVIPPSSPASSSSAPMPERTLPIALVSKLALPESISNQLEEEKNQGMEIRRRQVSFEDKAISISPLDEGVFDSTSLAEDQKIRTSTFLPIGFIGIMFSQSTFFSSGYLVRCEGGY